MEVKWILCPICGNKTQTMIREDTELRKACFIEACVDIGKDFLPKFVCFQHIPRHLCPNWKRVMYWSGRKIRQNQLPESFSYSISKMLFKHFLGLKMSIRHVSCLTIQCRCS